jgi:hypothetical protein
MVCGGKILPFFEYSETHNAKKKAKLYEQAA